MSAHLDSAARALESIMRELDPEHIWAFEVVDEVDSSQDELARRRVNAPGHDTEGVSFDAA